MSRPRPNDQAVTAALLLERTAQTITEALTHIAIEIGRCDGYPNGGTSETGRVSGGQRTIPVPYIDDHGHPDIDHVPVTSVEAVVLVRYRLNAWDDEIRVLLDRIERDTKALSRITHRALGQRAPVAQRQCRDGGLGKDLTPKLTGLVANCYEPPHAKGLCNTHYAQWLRDKRAAGIDTSGMYEPAQ
jgi:hypothetical protein